MNNQIDEIYTDLEKKIASFPADMQTALLWLINHYDALSAICKVKPLTEAQRSDYIHRAQEKNDDYVLLLILFERCING